MYRALVTGGSKGIGLAISKKLNETCGVTVCSRTHGCDVLVPSQIKSFLRQYGAEFDILINCVGGGGTWGNEDVTETDLKVWEQVYQKNAGAAILFTMACLPHMVKSGFGRVVTITSLGNDRPWFNMAKQAETALMETLSRKPEYIRRGITFNCVAPGRIAVGKEHDVTDEYLESLPLGRLGYPEEVADVVNFLCSAQASLVNGAVIKVGDV